MQKSCRPATFQSTLPRRERRYLTLFLSAPCRFQSTLPRRERQKRSVCAEGRNRFQSTLPRRERRFLPIRFLREFPYFNPRSREGSDDVPQIDFMVKLQFQSTLPRRERQVNAVDVAGAVLISIHAPAKGATKRICRCFANTRFQSTLPRRERLFPLRHKNTQMKFQSTLPRRERQKTGGIFIPIFKFQSTLPRRERHSKLIDWLDGIKISIHAPAKGATICWKPLKI